MTAKDEENRSAIFRGNLLELASFMTKIQSQLAPEGLAAALPSPSDDHDVAVPVSTNNDTENQSDFLMISIQDLQKVLEYRSLLHEEGRLLNDIAMAKEVVNSDKRFSKLSQLMVEKLGTRLEMKKASLQKHSIRTKRVHFLWTRLEVWWTKIVSQNLLLSSAMKFSDENNQHSPVCCFSPLLNLPGSKHFRNALPQVVTVEESTSRQPLKSVFYENTLSCCSMPLPPNKHTWKEFARILTMVSLLEDEPNGQTRRKQKSPLERALRSPCCYHDALSDKQKHHRKSLNKSFEFQPHDLIALWTRAQRNTQALRQLWMIFEVKPLPGSSTSVSPSMKVRGESTGGSGKQLIVDETGLPDSPGAKKPREFIARLSGNPNYTQIRVQQNSARVDQLTGWAVTNQVLFTYQHIKRFLMVSPLIQKKRKYKSVLQSEENERQKRVKRDYSDKSHELELYRSCQLFVLQLFARRNRFATSFLLTTNFEKHLDPGVSKTDLHLVSTKTFIKVRNSYRQELERVAKREGTALHIKDKTLANIGERLFLEGRYAGPEQEENAISLRDQIIAMLTALADSAEWNAGQHSLIKQATDDFEKLYNHFFNRNRDVYDIAWDLVDMENASAAYVANLLKNVPKPWPKDCSVCGAKDKGEYLSCSSCERVFHSAVCSEGHRSVLLPKLVTSNESLQRTCRLVQPEGNVVVPDYKKGDSLKYEEVQITIRRELQQDGSFSQIGLVLRMVEECAGCFEKLLESSSALGLHDVVEEESRTKSKYPMKGVEAGYLVVDIKGEGSCGKAAGIQTGDIIVSIEYVDFKDPGKAETFERRWPVQLAGLPLSEMIKLMKAPSTTIRIKVLRPSRDIVDESRQWFSLLKKVNRGSLEMFRELPDRFLYCTTCLLPETNPSNTINSVSKSHIVEEATRCRAVVRRIAMEGCALPFIEEDVFMIQDAFNHGRACDGFFFSLRRLDAIMTSFIERDMRQIGEDTPVSNEVILPPWARGNSPARRFIWAEGFEDQPVDLLCNALRAWQEVEVGELKKGPKMQLTGLFFTYIASWCILPSLPNRGDLIKTKGPPEIFLGMREPWLVRSCVFCCSQSRDDGSIACKNAACIKMLRSDSFTTEDANDENTTRISRDMEDYNERSSFVGTTFLVLPDDPLVNALKSVLEVDHCGRPVEFVVASYLPAAYVPAVTMSKAKDLMFDKYAEGDDIYHLLPIFTERQLDYVLQRCSTRKKVGAVADTDGFSWVSLDVLNLPGVARYSYRELLIKSTESEAIRRSIDENVALVNDAKEAKADALFYSPRADRSDVASQMHLVDTAVSSKVLSGSFRRFLSVGQRDECLDEVEWEFDSDGIEVQRGLLVTNSTPITVDVLRPQRPDCSLLYSDLHHSTPEPLELVQSLIPQSLDRPETLSFSEATLETILLQRSEGPTTMETYKGVGFGFEVVQWLGDERPRIGRIHKSSPAYASGLKTGDVLLSAGGHYSISAVAQGSEIAKLATALLGIPLHVRLAPACNEPIRLVLSAVKESKIRGDSVVVTVLRPKMAMDNSREVEMHDTLEVQQAVQGEHQSTSSSSDRQLREDDLRNTQPRTEADDVRIEDAVEETSAFDAFDVVNEFDLDPIPVHTTDRGGQHSGQHNDVTKAGTDVTNAIPIEHNDSTVDHGVPEPPLQNPESFQAPPQYLYDSRVSRPRTPVESLLPSGPVQHTIMPSHPQYQRVMTSQTPQSPLQGRNFTLNSLLRTIQSVNEQRAMASFGHLYQAAEGSTVLTLLECAMFFECLDNRQPKLGIRLLCPRYSLQIIREQCQIMASWSVRRVQSIPRVSKSIYDHILKLDYDRSMNTKKPETGEIIFEEGSYSYRMPVDILPIDRQIERVLQKESEQQEIQRREFEAHFQSRNDLGYTVAAVPLSQQHSRADFPQAFAPSTTTRTQAHPYPPPIHEQQQHSTLTNHVPLRQTTLGATGHTVGHDGFVDRIRGGGPLSSSDIDNQKCSSDASDEMRCHLESAETLDMSSPCGKCLTVLPKESWKGLAVYAGVATDDDCEDETMLVGFVENVESDETVNVEAHYLASIGYFDSPQTFPLYPEDIFVVNEHSETEQAVVIEKVRKSPLNTKSLELNTAEKSKAECLQLAAAFIRGRCDGMKILGTLPDGRHLIWIPNDHGAVYLATHHRDKVLIAAAEEYTLALEQHINPLSLEGPSFLASTGTICCPWGCSVQSPESGRRLALSFTNILELREHCEGCHIYGARNETVMLGGDQPFVRVYQGRDMSVLAAAISGAIIALLPSLLRGALRAPLGKENLPCGTEFTPSPIEERLYLPWTDESFRDKLSLQAQKTNNSLAKSLVDLWIALGSLFEVDESSFFRLNQRTIETVMQDFTSNFAEKESCTLQDCCQLVCASDFKERRFVDCMLCAQPWETCTERHVSSQRSVSGGIGCILRSDAVFEKTTPVDETKFPGSLGEAKALLLRVAVLIHTSSGLQLKEAVTVSDRLLGNTLWNGGNFESWKAFVRACSNPKMCAQALVVLLESIDRKKMPPWWNHPGAGWSTSHVIMCSANIESFFLHLYVLDIAISEAMGKSFMANGSDGSPNNKRGLSQAVGPTAAEMAEWMALAKELGFQRYSGEHEEECMICDENGADLLCCELCAQVQHVQCCKPHIMHPSAFEWICGSCINDICHRKNIQRNA